MIIYKPFSCSIVRDDAQNATRCAGKGSNPEWNESFVFTISDGVTELAIKLKDSDTCTADDFVGEAT